MVEMNWKKSKTVYHGIAWGIAVCAAVIFLVVLNAVSGITVPDTLTQVFTDNPTYGDWEISVVQDGIEHIYSSAHGDDPAQVLSPIEYWITFHGVGNLLFILCGIAASIGLGYGIASAFFRFVGEEENETRTEKKEGWKNAVLPIVFVVIFLLIVFGMLFASFN